MQQDQLLLGCFWGALWGIGFAAFLQWVPIGQYIVERVTWLSVVIGVGVDLLILGPFIGWPVVMFASAVIGASSIGIVGRSLLNYQREHIQFEQMLDARAAEDAE
jgi:hypothetical protein